MQRASSGWLAAVFVLAGVPSIGAQTIRGDIVDQGSGAPVPSALVLLLDAQGKRVAGTISDDSGYYSFVVPAAGNFRVRVLRIGFRSVESPPLAVTVGQVLEHRVAASAVPTVLQEVRVTERSRCEAKPGEAQLVGQLWEEVRKALLATVITQETRFVRMRLAYYERQLHPHTLRPGPERNWETEDGVSDDPFVTLPPERLARDGFVQRAGDAWIFYGPDARLLLSDEFLEGHCLRTVPADKDNPGMVGIGFEPTRGNELVDVEGTLWLDARTAELRHLNFEYVHLPVVLPRGRAGGRVNFAKLENGAWVVQNWYIRMPQFGEPPPTGGLPNANVAGSSLRMVRVIIEQGGKVASAAPRDAAPQVAAVSEPVAQPAAPAPITEAPAPSADVAVADSTVSDTAAARPLSPVTVTARVSPELAGTGFEERRERGTGYFFTADEIQRRRASRLMDILRGVPGVTVVRDRGGNREEILQIGRGQLEGRSGQLATPVLDRKTDPGSAVLPPPTPEEINKAVSSAPNCSALFFVDGQDVDVDGGPIDALVAPSEILGIEVYRNAQAPVQFRRQRDYCGVVLIWTHRRR
ncbi:MAG TPA: carboxypeptidase regulatory-like domain-containing protein [Gemmatimonadaceae bacterium]|nr:carboxypeptidase regulatory-like domain-containing protein [Gemmatimonadaceae bacterium]